MNDFKQRLAKELREQFPELDIRTDQCDVVRIYIAHRQIAVSQEQSGYTAKVIALDSELDFESSLEKVLVGQTVEEIREKVCIFLRGN